MFIDFIISRILRISRKNNFPINFLRVSGSFIKEFLEFPEFFDYRVFFIVPGNWFIQLWNSSNFLLFALIFFSNLNFANFSLESEIFL